jgi:hypothetical protein
MHTEIKDIIDYKKYNIVNRLFQLVMVAEKELQGYQLMKMKTSFTPRSASTVPSRTAMAFGARSTMTTSASRSPSTSSTPSTIALHTTDPSKASVLQGAEAVKPSSSTVAMVLATSSVTAQTRKPTFVQLTEVMYVLVILKMI